MRVGIAECLQTLKHLPKDDQIIYLKDHNHVAIQKLLQLAFDARVKWLLPEGKPPYKQCQFIDQENMFYNEVRRLYLFLEGGNPNLRPLRREQLFIQLLESLMPDDAKFLLSVRNKNLEEDYGITLDVVQAAFPGLIEVPIQKVLPSNESILKKVLINLEPLTPPKRKGGTPKGHKFSAETIEKMRATALARNAKKREMKENEQKLQAS